MSAIRLWSVWINIATLHHVSALFWVALTHPSGDPLVGLAAGQILGIAKDTYNGAQAVYPYIPKPLPYTAYNPYTTPRPLVTFGKIEQTFIVTNHFLR